MENIALSIKSMALTIALSFLSLISFSQTSEVEVSVNWPSWSGENRVEIYQPDGTLIATIDDGYDGSFGSYSTTSNLECLADNNNSPSGTGYYAIVYERYGDGWNSGGTLTITSGGVTVLFYDENAEPSSNDLHNSGSGEETQTLYFEVANGGAACVSSPEINIQGNGYDIADGDTTPVVTDDTEFGSIANATTLDHTFTIQNTGSTTLNLTGTPDVAISGNAAFSILTQPGASFISSGGSDLTFVVRFAPTVDLTNAQATISIANDDSDEDPYTFVVQGSSYTPTPEINIQGSGNDITDGDDTPVNTDDTDFGDVVAASGTEVHTFTIQNTGTATLNLTGGAPYVTISGTNAADFNITATPSASISSGSSTTFTITFDPSALGLRTATVSIANDDDDENLYTFDIQGTGITASYCSSYGNTSFDTGITNVIFNTINNSDGSPKDNGYEDFTGISTTVTQSSSYTLSVNLDTDGGYTVHAFAWIDWNQNGDFTDSGESYDLGYAYSVSNGTTSMTPSITIPATATLGNTRMRISARYNSDPDSCDIGFDGEVEDYTLNIITSTPLPEIDVLGNGTSITNGDVTPNVSDDTDFGNADITLGTVVNTFTIENTGTGTLNLTGISPYVTISGTNAADFSVTATPSASIASGGSITFNITFNPSAIGTRTAIVSIANDDSDENPYTFNIQGNGTTTAQEIDVLGNGNSITNGDLTPSVTDDTDFGNVQVSSGTSFQTFTIENYGTVNSLNLTGSSPYVAISGAHASDFTVTATPTTPIAASGNTTFTITFDPSALGLRTATLTIANDDSDEASYTFNIQGTGTNITGPGGVTSGLQLWLKGTSGLAYTDGQSVSLWEDQGNGTNATAPVAGVEPTYRDNATHNINFNPVVDFDNTYSSFSEDTDFSFDNTSTQFLQGTGGYYSQDVFIVLLPDTTINSSFGSMDVFCGDEDISTNETDATGIGLGAYSVRFSGEIISYAHGTTNAGNGYGVAETGTGSSYDNVSIINARNNSGATQQELYHNANDIETTQNDVADFANVNNSRYWIGRSEGWEATTDARIAEIITFSSRKNDTDLTQERNRIQSYLAIKYGITLGINGTSQDYVDSSGNVIWDQSNNSGYNYDIAGIGRDDNSALIQKQSSSINNATDGTGLTEGILTIGLSDIYDTNNLNISGNATTFNDQEFLIWGNNGVDLDLAASVINVDMSASISGLSTPVTFTGMQRIWKFVEIGGDIPSCKVKIPQNAIRNISPPGSYLMFISDTPVFDPTADYRVMTSDGSGNLETDYDFNGTKYITFGYAPQVIVERSIYFDGVADFIDIGDALDLNTSEFTISAWIKRDSGTTNASIISKRDASNTEGYDFRINTSGYLEFSINGGASTLTSSVIIPENEWHQAAVIYDSGNMTLYIDGVQDTSTSSVPNPVATTQSFCIAAADDNNPTAFFAGNIDEVRVWNIALSIDQLRFIMNQEVEEDSTFVNGTVIPQSITKNEVSSIPWSDLEGYYPMSIYTYTNTNDMSGHDNQGALRNLDTVDYQTAPLPYETQGDGNWTTASTWLNNSVQTLPNAIGLIDSTPIEWNIVEIHNDVTADTYTTLGREIVVQSLSVDASSTLEISGSTASNTGNGLTVTHYLKIDGLIDLEGESQLIQSTDSDFDSSSTGDVERDQQGTPNTYVYNYWSSPVAPTSNANYTIADVFSGLNFITTGYNGTSSPVAIADYWIWKYSNRVSNTYSQWQHVRSTGSLAPGEGFTMKGPGSAGTNQNYVFNGQPNNGDINLTITAGNDYLVGNPYPSALDADEFILDNIGTADGGRNTSGNIINGALYFWDHFAINSHNLGDYQGGYASYTLIGGTVAISNDTRINATGATGTKLPERYIPVGQGFFVSATADPTLVGLSQPVIGGTLEFKNSQRTFVKENVSGSNTGSLFLKSKTKGTSSISGKTNNHGNPRIRLLFHSPEGYYRQLLVGSDSRATNNFDLGFDAPLIEDNKEDLYWMFDDNKFVIQGIADFETNQRLPLGIKVNKDGEAIFKIDSVENLDENFDIFIHDKLLDTYHNLKEGDYEAYVTTSTNEDRFELTFNSNSGTLNNQEFKTENIQVYYDNELESIVLINPELVKIQTIKLYNVIGQLIKTFKIEDSTPKHKTFETSGLNDGTYIINLISEGKNITKKVLVK